MSNLVGAPHLAKTPTFLGSVVFRFKASLFQIQRGFHNFLSPTLIFLPFVKRSKSAPQLNTQYLIAESRSPLWTSNLTEERQLQAGKIHNLRVAIRHLNGLQVCAGQVFSFWAHIGKPTRRAGYVAGRELREGCIIASVGGGLCQLSNALYAVALKTGCNIIERHAHSQVVSGSAAELGQDATVFWNYVDLRFSAPFAFRIEARLESHREGDQLVVCFLADKVILPVNQDIQRRLVSFSPRPLAACRTESRQVNPNDTVTRQIHIAAWRFSGRSFKSAQDKPACA
jgi:vancomycin resistance protein YoaR